MNMLSTRVVNETKQNIQIPYKHSGTLYQIRNGDGLNTLWHCLPISLPIS